MKIIIHDGLFHQDDVTSYAFLNYLYPDNTLIRTRELENIDIDINTIVIDVGRMYDPYKNRFDHHQTEFGHTFDKETKIKMSSTGLVYKHFGV